MRKNICKLPHWRNRRTWRDGSGCRSVLKLGLHRKQASGLNIWTCEVTGPRKSRRLHGYLLSAPEALFREMPPDNPYLRLLTEAVKRENSAAGNKNDNEQG